MVRLRLPLGHAADWRSGTFTPHRTGPHGIVLESSNPAGPRAAGLFGGAIELELSDSHGRITLRKIVDGQSIEHPVPSGTVSTPVALVDIPRAGGVWSFSVRTARGDARFASAYSTVAITPPARMDVGWHVFGMVVGVGVLTALGGLLVAAGGWLARARQRNSRA